MRVHFPRFGRHPVAAIERPVSAHEIESDFRRAICRFVIDCSCGAHHETPFIDEALEWREMHSRLAPLTDRMTS
jgi:hypothetical protein